MGQVSMTPEERAERLARQVANSGVHEWSDENEITLAKDIAAEIKEAEEKAFNNGLEQELKNHRERERAIRDWAFEECAKIAETRSGLMEDFSEAGCSCAEQIRTRAKELKSESL